MKQDGTTKEFGPLVLVLCPAFFELKNNNAEMIKEWQRTLGFGSGNSKGRILVHEVQHMAKGTSPSEPAEDLSEPFPDVFGHDTCYSPSWYVYGSPITHVPLKICRCIANFPAAVLVYLTPTR